MSFYFLSKDVFTLSLSTVHNVHSHSKSETKSPSIWLNIHCILHCRHLSSPFTLCRLPGLREEKKLIFNKLVVKIFNYLNPQVQLRHVVSKIIPLKLIFFCNLDRSGLTPRQAKRLSRGAFLKYSFHPTISQTRFFQHCKTSGFTEFLFICKYLNDKTSNNLLK